MVKNLFGNFLEDPDEYQQSERYWMGVWSEVVGSARYDDKWQTPWLGTGSLLIKDGNPIFSAFSPVLRRGIRVVQQEPIEPGLDFQVWLDTFGGGPTDPDSVHELVIACVLSDVAAYHARTSMMTWVAGDSMSFSRDGGGRLVLRPSPRRSNDFQWTFDNAA
jgi:hypothetical protein